MSAFCHATEAGTRLGKKHEQRREKMEKWKLLGGNKERSIRHERFYWDIQAFSVCVEEEHTTGLSLRLWRWISRTPFVSVLDLMHFLSKQLEVL